MVFSNKKELLKKIYNRIESIISLLLTGSAKDSNFIVEDFKMRLTSTFVKYVTKTPSQFKILTVFLNLSFCHN
tara:strand:- start:152 stop:370 length:219 start_codon:yes stop_codon:yes gene_type:complete